MDLKESEEFAMSLIILGVVIAKDGDAKRILDWVEPDMFANDIARRGIKSLMGRDRGGVAAFLKIAGVELVPGELAVDAIVRTFIDIVDARADQHKIQTERARARERELMIARSNNAGKPTKETVQHGTV